MPPPRNRYYSLNTRTFRHHKTGFTLAEVLITLGIIGIVAAMTLPTLVGNYRKKELEVRLKKAYSVINNVHNTLHLKYDNVYNYFVTDNPTIELRRAHFEAFFNELQAPERCGSLRNITSKKCFDTTTGSLRSIYKTLNNKETLNTTNMLQENAIIDRDGTIYFVGNVVNFQWNNSYTVDINGKKGPNRAGYDVFIFFFDTKDDKLTPYRLNGFCDKDNSNVHNGFGCTYYAVNNICPWDENKTYWECIP